MCVYFIFVRGLDRYSLKTMYLIEFAYDIFQTSAIFYNHNVKLEPFCRVTIFALFAIHFLQILSSYSTYVFSILNSQHKTINK